MRDEEATRGAALGRLKIEQENFDREVERTDQARAGARARAPISSNSDIAREQNFITEAKEILSGLDAEIAKFADAEEGAEAAEAAARKSLEQQETELRDSREKARRAHHPRRRSARQTKEPRNHTRRARAGRRQARTPARGPRPADARNRRPRARRRQTQGHGRCRPSPRARNLRDREGRARRRGSRAHARRRCQDAPRRGRQGAPDAERAQDRARNAVVKLVGPPREDGLAARRRPASRSTPGYEAALGAALGDDLEAPAAPKPPCTGAHLEIRSEDGALPDGVEPLIAYCRRAARTGAPPEADRRRLTREHGHALQSHLKPGQRLVSREGDLWRWDGFVAAAARRDARRAAPDRAQPHRPHRRARGRGPRSRRARSPAPSTRRRTPTPRPKPRSAACASSGAKSRAKLAETRDALTQIERAARETESKLAAVAGAKTRADERSHRAARPLRRSRCSRSHCSTRAPGSSRSWKPCRPRRRPSARAPPMPAPASPRSNASIRCAPNAQPPPAPSANAGPRARPAPRSRSTALKQRIAETETELEPFAELPAAPRRAAPETALAASAPPNRAASRPPTSSPPPIRRCAPPCRPCARRKPPSPPSARPRRAPKPASKAPAHAVRTKRAASAKRSRPTPEGLLKIAEHAPGTPTPLLADVDRALTKLKADRERLGGVNLQADDELGTLQQQFTTMDTERADVEQAINKLRGAIGHLNREAKVRLDEAFTTVNAHFGRLFTTLFGGGEARLEIVESEDPLGRRPRDHRQAARQEAGDAVALSGGEQTLTALSLDLRGIPDQPVADLRARRGRRAAWTTPTSTASAR